MADNDREARMEALAAALIHRFNNVLMGIQPHVEVIKRAGKDNERVLGSATQIETALRRAKAVMVEVGRLARPSTLNMQPLAVDEWFASLERELPAFSTTNPVSLSFDAGDDLTLLADRNQLTHAIGNVVTNAVESMPNGGSISIAASSANDGIEVTITDNGTGIAPEVLARAFEPLFTTKRNSAGLGLPVAQQIVEAHGGTMRLESHGGEGTKVTLVLRRPPRA